MMYELFIWSIGVLTGVVVGSFCMGYMVLHKIGNIFDMDGLAGGSGMPEPDEVMEKMMGDMDLEDNPLASDEDDSK